MRRNFIRASTISVPLLSLVAGAAYAQGAVSAASNVISVPAGFAAPAFQVPVASGAGWGSVGVGVYGQTVDIPGGDSDTDGSMGLNVGFGDPVKAIGLDVSLGLSALTGSLGEKSFGEAGSFGAKLHTNLPGLTSFAVGVQTIGRFGLAGSGNTSSLYSSITKFFEVGAHNGVSATIGVGDGAFTDDGEGVGLFGAAAFYVTPKVSLIAEYTGRFANLGVSLAPVNSLPLSLTLGAVNVADRDGFGGTQFAGSVGYGFGF